MRRFVPELHLPRGSADAVAVVLDTQSGHMIVEVDGNYMLDRESQEALAQLIADAMNSREFEPSYDDA